MVLLADIVPAFAAKVLMTQWLEDTAYSKVVNSACILSLVSLFLVAFSRSATTSLLGVAMASWSSGMGESTFLTLSSAIADNSGIVGWASGTGMAGLVGAVSYYLWTVVCGVSPRIAILSVCPLPMLMWVAFHLILKDLAPRPPAKPEHVSADKPTALVLRLLVPLYLVYLSEYTVNMGIVPIIASTKRSVFVGCQAAYQVGIFVGRSLALKLFPRGLKTAPLAAIQIGNLVLVSLFVGTPLSAASLALLMATMLWEGLVGGVGYVMTYSAAKACAPAHTVDWVVSRVSVADCLGIMSAGLLCVCIEPLFGNKS